MGVPSGHVGDVVCFPLIYTKQVTGDVTSAIQFHVPFNCTAFKAVGRIDDIGGTTLFTDIDLMIENGTSDILAAAIPVVGSSTIITANGSLVTESFVSGMADLDEDDVLHLDIDGTGTGSSHTADGVGVYLWVVRR